MRKNKTGDSEGATSAFWDIPLYRYIDMIYFFMRMSKSDLISYNLEYLLNMLQNRKTCWFVKILIDPLKFKFIDFNCIKGMILYYLSIL